MGRLGGFGKNMLERKEGGKYVIKKGMCVLWLKVYQVLLVDVTCFGYVSIANDDWYSLDENGLWGLRWRSWKERGRLGELLWTIWTIWTIWSIFVGKKVCNCNYSQCKVCDVMWLAFGIHVGVFVCVWNWCGEVVEVVLGWKWGGGNVILI